MSKGPARSIELISNNWDLRNSTNIDRSTANPDAKRIVPMRVLSLGFPRTATMSTVAALEKLGFNGVYHGVRLLENPPDMKIWRRAIRAKANGTINEEFKKEDWDALLGHVEATTDFPTVLFADELMATYPEAKVILNARPADAWWNSARETVVKLNVAEGRGAFIIDFILYWFAPFLSGWLRIKHDVDALFGGVWASPDRDAKILAIYEEHNRHIREDTPPERLLCWGPQDGWEPLCKFLDLPIPAGPVPHINEKAVIKRNVKVLIKRELRQSLMRIAVVGLLIYLALKFLKSAFA